MDVREPADVNEGEGQQPNASNRMILEYARNAQNRLLTVFEEVTVLIDERHMYENFLELFRDNLVDPVSLVTKLQLYMDLIETSLYIVDCVDESSKSTLKYQKTVLCYKLMEIVIPTLMLTVSVEESLKFDEIMEMYRRLKTFFEGYSEFCREKLKYEGDEEAEKRNAKLPEVYGRHLLILRGAFRDILLHKSELAEEQNIASNRMISEDARKAQKNLFRIFLEVTASISEKHIYDYFYDLFHNNQVDPVSLTTKLQLYMELTKISLYIVDRVDESSKRTLNEQKMVLCCKLMEIVIPTLMFTMSVEESLKFDEIKEMCRRLKTFFEGYSEFCWEKLKYEGDEETEKRNAKLPEVYGRHLLRLRKAFNEFLLHMGEVAEDQDKASNGTISEYARNAQKLILRIFSEVTELIDERNMYDYFYDLYHKYQVDPDSLITQLQLYMDLTEASLYITDCVDESGKSTLKYQKTVLCCKLMEIVTPTLTFTMSVEESLKFDEIMEVYRRLRAFYEGYSEFCREKLKYEGGEEAEKKKAELPKQYGRYLLRLRNAFREILFHIGEYAEKEEMDIGPYEVDLFDDDKSYLRGRISRS